MSELISPGVQVILVSLVLSFALVTVLSPLLLWWYRRRVAHWMSQGRADDEAAATTQADPPGPPPRWVRLSGQLATAATSSLPAGPHTWSPGQLRLVAGHAASGGICALLLTVAFCSLFSQYLSATMVATVLLAALVPTAALVLVLLSTSTRQRVLSAAAAGALLWMLPGDSQSLASSLYLLFVLAPLGLLVVFGLRFWRGVAPMVLVVSLAASALAVTMALLGSRGLGLETVWGWRLAGLIAGAWLGYRALQALQRAFDAGRFSDLDLFIDTWWLALLLVQATVLAVMAENPAYLALVAAYPLVVGVRRALWRTLPLAKPEAAARPLLLLRVFSKEGRMEALFDRIEQQWRHIGPIHMIAGWDLALRNIGPSDFVAFVAGRLRSQFISSAQQLQERLQSLPTQRDADGRFRVSHFWCHSHTWQPTMRALAARSHAVLMDLRGFNGDREGCCYELLHLARHAPEMPVLLLVDSPEVYAELQRLLGGVESASAAWMVADVASDKPVLPPAWLERLSAGPATRS
ncbi:hypothetical protein [Roseateles sp.]|uniref:hypothetical protein n=1 Tax=Roseateles sp. TaxID=1971397 RepID=UPI003BA836F0